MPTYEYVCAKCDHRFETVQSILDRPLTVCRKEICPQKKWGKGKVTRAIGGSGGLIFKGSGFYITDYRSENYKAGAKKEAPPSPTEKSKTGGESKPSSPSTATPAKTEPKKAAPPASDG